jgi:hypothetical protein
MRRILVVFFLFMALLAYFPSGSAPLQLSAAAQSGNPYTVVWADKDYGIYHCPGSRYYGKTRNGLYLYQNQAQQKGFRPAYGWVCR